MFEFYGKKIIKNQDGEYVELDEGIIGLGSKDSEV